jgi:hypothetical protein
METFIKDQADGRRRSWGGSLTGADRNRRLITLIRESIRVAELRGTILLFLNQDFGLIQFDRTFFMKLGYAWVL